VSGRSPLKFSERLVEFARSLFSSELPAFVILLQSSPARRTHVWGHTKRLLPHCEIVSAVEREDARGRLEAEGIQVSDGVPAGKLACSASHIAVWREIVRRGVACALVLEDDVALRPGFSLFVQRLKRQLPRDFDLVHLYVSYDRKEWRRKAVGTKQLFLRYAPRWGRSAYMVSLQGAEKLLADFRTISDHGDVQMARMAQQGRLLTFCASKASVDNLGQTRMTYRGEQFPSTVW